MRERVNIPKYPFCHLHVIQYLCMANTKHRASNSILEQYHQIMNAFLSASKPVKSGQKLIPGNIILFTEKQNVVHSAIASSESEFSGVNQSSWLGNVSEFSTVNINNLDWQHGTKLSCASSKSSSIINTQNRINKIHSLDPAEASKILSTFML